MDDAVTFASIKDDARYTRDDGVVKERVYTFYFGKHGPFVERVPLDPFDPSEIDRRVMALRTHLQTLPK